MKKIATLILIITSFTIFSQIKVSYNKSNTRLIIESEEEILHVSFRDSEKINNLNYLDEKRYNSGCKTFVMPLDYLNNEDEVVVELVGETYVFSF